MRLVPSAIKPSYIEPTLQTLPTSQNRCLGFGNSPKPGDDVTSENIYLRMCVKRGNADDADGYDDGDGDTGG